ncbi:RNA-binding S4 domain-containing protein [Rhizobium sp. CRIBSB]|nr:RNA-binding S4 domain-containing protein [Rhizobium sp. CRIBSB]
MGTRTLIPAEDACRIDVWLWRARFVKTRSLAAALVESGAVRLTHANVQVRLDKPSRLVRPGDRLLFVLNGILHDLAVESVGVRRGPAAEARALYRPMA